CREVVRDADHHAGPAILGQAYDDHHARTDLLLALVGEAAQVLEVDAGNGARDELHAGDFAYRFTSIRFAATHRQFLASVGKIALELLAFVEQRGNACRHLLQRYFKLRRRRFSGLKLLVSGLPRAFAGQRLNAPHAGGDSAVAQHRNQADVAGAPHMRATAKLDRPAKRIAATLAHRDHAHLVAV